MTMRGRAETKVSAFRKVLDEVREKGLPRSKERAERLQKMRNKGFDVAAFMRNTNAVKMLETPLGPSEDCISPAELQRVLSLEEHLRQCGSCRQLRQAMAKIRARRKKKPARELVTA